MRSLQDRSVRWATKCFGETACRDKAERSHRFLEEALELVQSTGCTREDAHMLVDYVYGRPVGDLWEEIGGTYHTLALLCHAYYLNLDEAAEDELERAWINIERIRAKRATKPAFGPLPGETP